MPIGWNLAGTTEEEEDYIPPTSGRGNVNSGGGGGGGYIPPTSGRGNVNGSNGGGGSAYITPTHGRGYVGTPHSQGATASLSPFWPAGENNENLGPSGSGFRPMQLRYEDVDLGLFGQLDHRNLFNQIYEGMSAYNDAGFQPGVFDNTGIAANQRDVANQMDALGRMLAQNPILLGDDLAGINRGELDNLLNVSNKQYGTNVGEINRMKEFLLLALAERNKMRDEQRLFQEAQKGFVSRALAEALEKSELFREESRDTHRDNVANLISNATGRGAWRSKGLARDEGHQGNLLENALEQARQADVTSQRNRDEAMESIRSALEQIRLQGEADRVQWAEDNAGLDSDLARLAQDKEKFGYKYMASVARINKEAEARRREENIRNRMLSEQQRANNIKWMEAVARHRFESQQMAARNAANAQQGRIAAGMDAFGQTQAFGNQRDQFLRGLSDSQLQDAARQAWESGNQSLYAAVTNHIKWRGAGGR